LLGRTLKARPRRPELRPEPMQGVLFE